LAHDQSMTQVTAVVRRRVSRRFKRRADWPELKSSE
jgi:hypothetical protein